MQKNDLPAGISSLLPAWITHYRREHLATDMIAGIVVAVLVLPQSLAYALLAGLPPQAGLYVSIFPVIVYSLVGSSMTQAIGPVAITAILTYSVLSPLATPGSALYLALAATLSLMSGLMILAFGVLRLGFLSNLLSRPVVSGFISGSAVLIVLSQVKYLLGVPASGVTTWQTLCALAQHAPEANSTTVVTGFAALIALYMSRKWMGCLLLRCGLSPNLALFATRLMPLLIIISATASVFFFDLDTPGKLAVVGVVREGIPSLSPLALDSGALRQLGIPALLLAFIGMVQNITMAQALAIKRRERMTPNKELVGLGISNVIAGLYGGMPIGGGISRTAVNLAAGAQTPLASIITALIMFCFVFAGAQWFAKLPLTVLAANIVIAALSMIDYKSLRTAWSYDRADAMALIVTAIGVILVGLEFGIALGIGLSLAALLWRASAPHIAVIGRIARTEHFRNVERYGVQTLPGVLFLRIDESLFFGNLATIEARLGSELEKSPVIHDVVLIMNAVNRVDTTAMEGLSDINRELAHRSIRLHLAEVKGPIQDRLTRSTLWKELSGHVFRSVNDAFETLERRGIENTGYNYDI